jgi:hypothetical protein
MNLAYAPGLLADDQRIVLHGLYLLLLHGDQPSRPAALADLINADYNDAGGHGIAINTPDTVKALPALVGYGFATEDRGRYCITNSGAEWYERLGGSR